METQNLLGSCVLRDFNIALRVRVVLDSDAVINASQAVKIAKWQLQLMSRACRRPRLWLTYLSILGTLTAVESWPEGLET